MTTEETPHDMVNYVTDQLLITAFLEMDRQVRLLLERDPNYVPPSRRQRIVRRLRWRLSDYRYRVSTAKAVLLGRHECDY